jgi:hypothetical protein
VNIQAWLKQKLDVFELRVKASKSKLAASVGHDTYWCAGYAQGYMAAQRDARRSARSGPRRGPVNE